MGDRLRSDVAPPEFGAPADEAALGADEYFGVGDLGDVDFFDDDVVASFRFANAFHGCPPLRVGRSRSARTGSRR